MSRQTHPQVVTANHLMEGDAVWFTADGAWTRHLTEAAVARAPEEADALLGAAKAQQDRVVGPYLADVALDPHGEPTPVHFREAFRTRGPSNCFHGKQAER